MPANPTGLSRRELYIDARDLQSDSGLDKPLTAEEYAALYLYDPDRQTVRAVSAQPGEDGNYSLLASDGSLVGRVTAEGLVRSGT